MSALLGLALALAAPQADAAEQAFEVRRWALFPEPRAARAAALEDSDWTVRARALAAIGLAVPRCAAAPGEAAMLVARLGDPQPNVRAAALQALAATPSAESSPDEATLDALSVDVFPGVRLELAAYLGASLPPSAPARLVALAGDADPRVAREARLNLLLLPGDAEGVVAAQAELVRALIAGGDEDALAGVIAALDRAPPGEALLLALRSAVREAGGALPDGTRRGLEASVEGLLLAAGGPGDAEALVDGWFASSTLAPRRLEHLRREASDGNARVALACLAAVEAAEALVLQGDPQGITARWPGLRAHLSGISRATRNQRLEELVGELLDLAVDTAPPLEVVRLARRRPLSGAAFARLLEGAGLRIERWDPELVSALLTSSISARRLAAARALGRALVHAGDPAAGLGLVRALEDRAPSVRAEAFDSLCDARDPALWVEALHAYWSSQPLAARIDALSALPRRAELLPFRDDLVALGEDPDLRRHAVELLEGLVGDAEARAAFERWLLRDLPLLRETGGARFRYVELRVMALVRGLSRVAGQEAVPLMRRALERSLGTSTDVGKTAAAALSRTPAGRAELPAFLGAEIDRRTRIEAAIGLAAADDERARDALLADYPHAAWDLRARMVAALASGRSPEAVALFHAVALDAGAEVEARVEAAGALQGFGPRPDVVAALAGISRAAPDPDTRRIALEGLGGVGGEAARKVLRARFRELAVSGDDLLREACLSALARAGEFPDELLPEVLSSPLAEADARARERFLGLRPPAPEFRWRGELEAVRSLAAAGRLGGLLRAAGPWWRLDAETLFALAAEALAGGARGEALSLARAAEVALASDPRPEATLAGEIRLLRLGLALSAESWDEAARLAHELVGDLAAGRLPRAVLLRSGGTREGRLVESRAWLDATRFQAAARAALQRGELGAARRAAARASARLGGSSVASTNQAALEATLRAAGD